MHVMSAATMTTMLQPTTMPTRALVEMANPWPVLLSLLAVDVEEMVGDDGALAPGVGVAEGEDGGWDFERVFVTVKVEDGTVDVKVTVVSNESESPRACGGQPMGSCLQGLTRQQPL
jgi:hypothetical protein